MLDAGHLLDNRYRLDERIATGGMGDVWRGTDVVLGRVIAVKVLRSAMLTDPEFTARFYGEARMMAAFRHPGVVEVYDYSSGEDQPGTEKNAYLVMAYVEGEPLSTRLKEAGRLGVAETMSIVAQAADALHAAHQHGTVHRDVKPGNLIVKPSGAVILVDFGVARSAAVTSVTGLNAIVGTALYMAPEQVAKGNVTPATDIYALGAVAYHCVSGVPPFDGDNALQVALRHLEEEPEPLPADVPLPVRELIRRAMTKDPADRFASAAEFAESALAAAGSMDWRTLSGTALPNLALGGPATTGPAMGGSPSHGSALTGTALTSPTNATAAPARTARVPRNLPSRSSPPARRGSGQPRAQLAVGLIVLALFLAAIGLGVALWLQDRDDGRSAVVPDVSEPAVPTSTVDPPRSPAPKPSVTVTRAPVVPNGQTPRRTTPPPTSAPPSSVPPSSAPVTSAPPSSEPPATTTPPPSVEPTTEPPTPTTGPPDDGGGEDGGDAGPDLPLRRGQQAMSELDRWVTEAQVAAVRAPDRTGAA